jgi:hypothetical protein
MPKNAVAPISYTTRWDTILRQRIEQHLVCLERISAHNESPAVSQLGMGNLQLGLLACGSACKRNPVSGVIGVQKGTTIPMV